jgi:pyruvate/2-oxoglutarate dehydrogenase complex dihydrolipoamide dehydrogenase (E3) component
MSFDRTDGLTKMLIDPESDRVLGVGIVGANAGELTERERLASLAAWQKWALAMVG